MHTRMTSRVERYGYRDKARIISIVDIVCSSINLGHTFLGFMAVSAYLSQLNSVDAEYRKDYVHFDSSGREGSGTAGGTGGGGGGGSGNGEIVFSHRAFKKLAWMIVMAQFAIHFSQLTFAINLYIGTAKNATAKAPAACRLWFITSSLLLGILGLRLFFQGSTGIYYMSEIIFRAVGMYIVGEYAKEVKNGTIAIYPPPPPVYWNIPAAHQTPADHLSHLPVFLPPHPDLPPKYEDVVVTCDQTSPPSPPPTPPPTPPPPPPVVVSPTSIVPLSTMTPPVNNNNSDTNDSSNNNSNNNNPLPPV